MNTWTKMHMMEAYFLSSRSIGYKQYVILVLYQFILLTHANKNFKFLNWNFCFSFHPRKFHFHSCYRHDFFLIQISHIFIFVLTASEDELFTLLFWRWHLEPFVWLRWICSRPFFHILKFWPHAPSWEEGRRCYRPWWLQECLGGRGKLKIRPSRSSRME